MDESFYWDLPPAADLPALERQPSLEKEKTAGAGEDSAAAVASVGLFLPEVGDEVDLDNLDGNENLLQMGSDEMSFIFTMGGSSAAFSAFSTPPSSSSSSSFVNALSLPPEFMVSRSLLEEEVNAQPSEEDTVSSFEREQEQKLFIPTVYTAAENNNHDQQLEGKLELVGDVALPFSLKRLSRDFSLEQRNDDNIASALPPPPPPPAPQSVQEQNAVISLLVSTGTSEIVKKAPYLHQKLARYDLVGRVAAKWVDGKRLYTEFKKRHTGVQNMQREFFSERLESLGLSETKVEGLRQFATAGGQRKVTVGEAIATAAFIEFLRCCQATDLAWFDWFTKVLEDTRDVKRALAKKARTKH